MAPELVVIPEKIYFKIGEVCELVGVQAHVLRYWETEFTVLSPQKNKSGQRSYRRRDVEIALRIKQLLYNEMFTIAGANKKLQQEAKEGSKAKATTLETPPRQPTAPKPQHASYSDPQAPMLFDAGFHRDEPEAPVATVVQADVSVRKVDYTADQIDVLKTVAANLIELRDMLRNTPVV